MKDIDVAVIDTPELRDREITCLLRAWFDSILDGLSAQGLRVLREQCLGAGSTAANAEIVATIDRRLAQIKGAPLHGN